MRSVSTFALGAITLSIVIISGCIQDAFWDFGNYDREIQRNYSTDAEYNAILHVENNVNLTEITKMPRMEDDWANFIDHEVIEHYNTSYNTDKEEEREADVYFYYTAWARSYDELSFKSRTEGYELQIRLNNDEYLEGFDDPPYLYLPNERLVLAHIENGTWTYENMSYEGDYWDEEHEMELYLNLTNVYFVMMTLYYDDIWGPLAAIFVDTTQFLILDENYDPLVVGVAPSPWMVS